MLRKDLLPVFVIFVWCGGVVLALEEGDGVDEAVIVDYFREGAALALGWKLEDVNAVVAGSQTPGGFPYGVEASKGTVDHRVPAVTALSYWCDARLNNSEEGVRGDAGEEYRVTTSTPEMPTPETTNSQDPVLKQEVTTCECEANQDQDDGDEEWIVLLALTWSLLLPPATYTFGLIAIKIRRRNRQPQAMAMSQRQAPQRPPPPSTTARTTVPVPSAPALPPSTPAQAGPEVEPNSASRYNLRRKL